MEQLTERSAIKLLSVWCESKVNRAGITQSTRNSIKTKCAALTRILETDQYLNEGTIVRILNMDGEHQYAYLHRLSKMMQWCTRWATENKLIEIDPLRKVKLPRPSYEHRKYWLTHQQLRQIEACPLDGRLAEIRDFFLLQCYTGLAYADVKKINRNAIYEAEELTWVRILRQKTSSRPAVILTVDARRILDKYDWQIMLPNNTEYNERLKDIQLAAGIKLKLHSHVACKTFVQLGLEQGYSVPAMAKRRGITDRTLTEHYGTINDAVVAKEFKLHSRLTA